MRKVARSLAISAGVALVVLGGVAAAETEAAELTTPTKSLELSKTQDVNMGPEQQLSRGQAILTNIIQTRSTIEDQLRLSRKSRDVVKVLCLNDKLNQVNVAQRSAKDRFKALEGATTANDKDSARHELTVLEVVNDRVRTLMSEANQCIGEEANFAGESEVSVQVDPNLPTDPSIPGGEGSNSSAPTGSGSGSTSGSSSIAGDSTDLSAPAGLSSPVD